MLEIQYIEIQNDILDPSKNEKASCEEKVLNVIQVCCFGNEFHLHLEESGNTLSTQCM